jgi:hypothetical protein
MTDSERRDDLAKGRGGKANILDMIEAGYGQYENDDLHDMQDNGSIGTTSPITSRKATPGGSFTYRMIVAPWRPCSLGVTVLTEDDGKKLTISVADEVIFDKILDHTKYVEDNKVSKYTIETQIPEELLKKAQRVTAYGKEYLVVPVRFEGDKDIESARITDFVTIR